MPRPKLKPVPRVIEFHPDPERLKRVRAHQSPQPDGTAPPDAAPAMQQTMNAPVLLMPQQPDVISSDVLETSAKQRLLLNELRQVLIKQRKLFVERRKMLTERGKDLAEGWQRLLAGETTLAEERSNYNRMQRRWQNERNDLDARLARGATIEGE